MACTSGSTIVTTLNDEIAGYRSFGYLNDEKDHCNDADVQYQGNENEYADPAEYGAQL